MTIQEFLLTALKGGWAPGQNVRLDPTYGLICDVDSGSARGIKLLDQTALYLDINAWRAVAKVRKWSYVHPIWQYTTALNMDIEVLDPAECAMHNMVMYLFEGKTIEDFLKTLS